MGKNDQVTPDVVWRLNGDALTPKVAPWGFIVQNPVQRVVPPGTSINIDTGVAASVPMIASVRGDQIDYVTVPMIVPAGKTLVVTVKNDSKHIPLVVDDAESLANVTPLVFKGTSVVD